MQLHIEDEYSPLKSVLICWGEHVPTYEDYKTEEPEFTKFHPYSWDKSLLLRQQDEFFKLLQKYDVSLVFPKTDPPCLWQMYTRDTAFVIGDTLYYSASRKFQTRAGELTVILEILSLPSDKVHALEHEIEGGDVIVTGARSAYIGRGSRTSASAITELSNSLQVHKFELGENVMHLDTRLTLMPNKIALINKSSFDDKSFEYLSNNYMLIDVSEEETKKLGTNVFVINPETVVVPTQHRRIGDELTKNGLKVEYIDYTEPINLGGSFRCTTLPLVRL